MIADINAFSQDRANVVPRYIQFGRPTWKIKEQNKKKCIPHWHGMNDIIFSYKLQYQILKKSSFQIPFIIHLYPYKSVSNIFM